MTRHLALISLALLAGVASAQAANTATLTWTGVGVYGDGTPIPATDPVTYTIYRGVSGATKSPVGTSATTSFVDSSGLAPATRYCWAVTAKTTLAAESAQSVEACKTFPSPTIPPPTGLTVR